MNRTITDAKSSALRKALGADRFSQFARQSASQDRGRTFLSSVQAATRRGRVETILMACAVVLGFWGFQEVTPPDVRWEFSRIWNSAFRTLQLLTTQFPDNLPVDMPVQLQIARFAMPVFAVWFSFAALLRRYNRPLVAWAARLSRSHVVVIGDSIVPVALARAFRRVGKKVVAITSMPQDNDTSVMEATGARVIFGDARRASILRQAAVHRASLVVIADDMGPDAIGIATSTVAVTRGLRPPDADPLVLLVRLAQHELRPLLSTQIAQAVHDSHVNLRLYIRERTIARSLLSRYPIDWGETPGAHDLHAVIVGCGEMGTELLLQLARIAVPTPGRRCVMSIVDRQASGLGDQLLAAYPGLAQCADLNFVDAEIRPSALMLSEVEQWFEGRLPATAIYVCCGDDRSNLSITIGLRRVYALRNTVAPSMFVYQREDYALVNGLPEIHGNGLDTFRIIPFGSIEEEADPFYLVDEEIDVLARLLHGQYLESQRRLGTGHATPAAVPWEELAESYRSASRSQADHIVAKLRTLGWHGAVASDAGGPMPAPAADGALLQQMASQEHERWCRERWLSGWVFDSKRNDAERRHDRLVPYAQLSEEVREFDRTTVTELPGLLGGLGISLRRDLRLGAWFQGRQSHSSNSLMEKALEKIARRVADGASGRHLQLVLPLRSPDESRLVSAIASQPNCGVDVALVRPAGTSGGSIGPLVDRNEARLLIAAADRAVVLTPTYSPDQASDIAGLSALCAVCDEVLLICEEVEIGESIVHQIDAGQRRKIELVAVEY
jgi:hypothetical protein